MRHILWILTCILSALSLHALPHGFYAPRSVLAEGNWVKISVDESGVYEISYQTLRSMGFSDPEKVGVYGRGGAMLPINFTASNGKPLLYDDLTQVGVLHLDNKLYFYAQGVDKHSYSQSSSLSMGGYYSRESKNVYTDKGYYFLSDTDAPLEIKTVNAADTKATGTISSGYGMTYHEVDLVQNNSNTGQLFFGEKLTGENSRMEWPLTLPGCIPFEQGVMECYFYLDRDVSGHLSYGINGANGNAEYDTKTYSPTDFRQQEPFFTELTMPGESSTVFVEFTTPADVDIAHLDFWTLTYPRYLPTLRDSRGNKINQEYISFPSIPRGRTWAATFSNAGSMIILDITTPSTPVILDGELQGATKTVHITNVEAIPELIVFDPLQSQKQISGYNTASGFMPNQNLHSQVADGADMLIICIPGLKEQAMRLAEIHEKYQGIKVVAATTEEVYNEFTQGIPDAMAYRSFVKAAYSTAKPVKNVLLLGPLSADFRGVRTERNQAENIIAYQLDPMNQLRGAQNANDFYGMMADRFTQSSLEKNQMQVGVGILPCRFASEAEIIIKKIETYLSRKDFAYYSNRLLNIGGIGDNHTHDIQARSMGNLQASVDLGSSVITPLIVDAYGFESGHDKLFDTLEDGTLMINYFGHGGPLRLNREGSFFTINDVYKLRNTFHPFMGFAGCEISNCDRGVRGLGEALVTGTPYGLIGTLLATRETWSGQNFDLFQTWMINFYCDGSSASSPLHSRNLTIGEIYARTKSRSTYNNELAYQLICDPALVFPVVSRPIILENERYSCNPGEYNTISGYVAVSTEDQNVDETFNGEVVIRLMEPFVQLTSQDLCTGENAQQMDIVYADTQVAMTTAQVENGRFTAELFIPAAMSEYHGRTGRMHSCAYNPETHIIAASKNDVGFAVVNGETSQDKDDTPPVIDMMMYVEETNSIRISVHDDLALSYSKQPLTDSFRLKIDGVVNATAARHEATVEDNGRLMYKDIPLNDLSEGPHTALLRIEDAAGNTATREIAFTYNPGKAKYRIELLETAVSDKATFRVIGTAPAKSDLIILDNMGNVVYRGPYTGSELIWDRTGNDGTSVAPGLYKAYLLEQGDYPDKSHSATIEVPVV